MKENLTLKGPSGQRHNISLSINRDDSSLTVHATYKYGDLCVPQGATVVNWVSYYDAPHEDDLGCVDIGAGSRYIEITELRGIGLGSFFMSFIVNWAKNFPELPVALIFLSIEDARTNEDRGSRNRFWRKLGFELLLDETESFGTSKPMPCSKLVKPELKLAAGWSIDEL